MSTENIPTNQFPQEMVATVTKELAAGKQPAQIIKGLEKQGWPKDAATAMVAQAQQAIAAYQQSPEGRQVMAAKYKKMMLVGIGFAVVGVIITVATYSAASRSGGTYFVWWGAVVFGIYDFIRGLAGWLKNKN